MAGDSGQAGDLTEAVTQLLLSSGLVREGVRAWEARELAQDILGLLPHHPAENTGASEPLR